MSHYVPVDLRRGIREHFREGCAYCLTPEELTVSIFEVEHIVPRSAGGETIFDNLCLACPTCNRYKAKRSSAVDAVTEEEAQLFHPHEHDWNEHFDWNDDHTEVVPLTDVGRVTVDLLRMNRPQLTRVRRMWVALDRFPPESTPDE